MGKGLINWNIKAGQGLGDDSQTFNLPKTEGKQMPLNQIPENKNVIT
jgi:hypothetical protein